MVGLAANEEAIALRCALAAARPDAFNPGLPGLASSLYKSIDLSQRSRTMGRRVSCSRRSSKAVEATCCKISRYVFGAVVAITQG